MAVYEPHYTGSHALLVGVDAYTSVPPLRFACADAEGIESALTTRFDFPSENITMLLDAAATRDAIMRAFLLFVDVLSDDDRLIVFFAGHGFTRSGRRGETGYLVPVDGNPNELSTLIRWDELTRNAELIPAKHILFLMDACYGGLALTRALAPGASRFVRDMLQRHSRQVLTAGKADEVVADAGGPRSNHSIFTGHLLDALEGAAAAHDGIVTANTVMAYVYDRVAKDQYSRQTPHFGFLDGDGDFVFNPPEAEEAEGGEAPPDLLIQIPALGSGPEKPETDDDLIATLKDYLSEPRHRIRLDDLITAEIRALAHATSVEAFPRRGSVTPEEFIDRLSRYESAVRRLLVAAILLAKWGDEAHQPSLERIVSRMADLTENDGGMTVWLSLEWYPLLLIMYVGGMAAISSGNYRSLATLFLTRLGARVPGRQSRVAIVKIVQAILEIDRANLFKTLPNHERNYVPRSEYLFTTLQPVIDDMLFVGSGFEELFDHFEVMWAVAHADIVHETEEHHFWGPPGRFAYKFSQGRDPNRLSQVISEARQAGAEWGPLKAGFFGGSVERFQDVASRYSELIGKLGWW